MRKEYKELTKYINHTPALSSILYDLDLLPEQVKEWTKDWRRMLILAAWWKDLHKED